MPSWPTACFTARARYKTLLMAPYAIAPVVAGVLWLFMFNPTVGIIAYLLRGLGYTWNHHLNGGQALVLVILAAAWKQISYNFLFFLAGPPGHPEGGHRGGGDRRCGPRSALLADRLPPAVAHDVLPAGGEPGLRLLRHLRHHPRGDRRRPAKATETLVYKVFNDGFIGLDFGGSAAQSVVLMAIVIGLTVVQFRYIERRVVY